MLKDTIISVPDYSEGFRKELYEKAMKAKALKNDDNKSRMLMKWGLHIICERLKV